MEFPTYHNRLLYYTVTDISDQNPENWELLRTVSYTYYITGQASNITIKDEDPDPDPVSGPDAAYDVYQDLALYYEKHGSLRIALWDSWEVVDQYGTITDYDQDHAREFRYDGPLQRYMDASYDDLSGYNDPNDWPPNQTVSWTEHAGTTVFNDAELTREEDTQNPGEYLFTLTDVERYAGPGARETVSGDNDGDIRYNHGDLIGSTMLTTDDSGTAASTAKYTAFGEILDSSGSPCRDQPSNRSRPIRYSAGFELRIGE